MMRSMELSLYQVMYLMTSESLIMILLYRRGWSDQYQCRQIGEDLVTKRQWTILAKYLSLYECCSNQYQLLS